MTTAPTTAPARLSVRPIEHEDLPRVSALFGRTLEPTRPTLDEQAAWFAATLLDHPWADPEIRSLVCEGEGGRIVGFLGVASRRMLFDGEPVRVAYTAHLVTDPDLPSGYAGGLLIRRFHGGAQDLAVSDTASPRVRELVEAAGGRADDAASVSWFALFRPVRGGLSLASGAGGIGRLVRPVARAFTHLPVRRRVTPTPGLTTRPFTVAAALEARPVLDRPWRLVPDYDPEYLGHLMRAIAEEPGEILARLVCRGDRAVGWFVVRMRGGDIAKVLDVRAAPREMDPVVGAMFAAVRDGGAAGLRGRLDPGIVEAVSSRGALFHVVHRVLFHSRREDLRRAVLDRSAALSPLLGEWW